MSKKLPSNLYSGSGIGIVKDSLSTQQVVRQTQSEAIGFIKGLGGKLSRL